METKRSYRHVEPSDLPRIQAGKLKAFFKWYDYQYPAELISVRAQAVHRAGNNTIWLVKANTNQLSDDSVDSIEYGTHNIIVDVTPEKRYAVWSHAIQRFIYTNNDTGFTSRTAAECCIYDKKNCYVVEWEIKGNE
jgi:hypothetical protein